MKARLLLVVAALVLLVSGCATFPEEGPRDWRPQADGEGELGGPPSIAPPEPKQQQPSEKPEKPGEDGKQQPTGPCQDPDERIVTACLGAVGGLVVLPDGESALAGELTTGRILRVHRDEKPVVVATVDVDRSAGEGLLGLALSPAYPEDRLIYALVRTRDDVRVVRIAQGEPAKPVLAGIPKDVRGGALGLDRNGYLLVATGRSAAKPADRLAGAVLRVDTLGRPAPGNTAPGSPVFTTGVTSPGGVCSDPATGRAWVTDRQERRDVVAPIGKGALGSPLWTWPARPGVAGCALSSGYLAVVQPALTSVLLLQLNPDGTVSEQPKSVLDKDFGRLRPAAVAQDGLLWTASTNKRDGKPAARDDVVVRMPLAPGGGGGDKS
ncbi:PQQ-dependent sugar dehydrogenase [Pseudonocardia phyllosphaerae]|uniref:PQQ-dependent sugar dehydrogenase n=1 Tax=Pseudonocardia phyllosphaerae TaxID=3390502 RepID=UPI00397BAB6E